MRRQSARKWPARSPKRGRSDGSRLFNLWIHYGAWQQSVAFLSSPMRRRHTMAKASWSSSCWLLCDPIPASRFTM